MEDKTSVLKGRMKYVLFLILIFILTNLVVNLAENLLFAFLPDSFDWLESILSTLISAVLSFLSVVSGMYIVRKTILEKENWTLSQVFTEYFHYFAQNWKQNIGTYAIWNFLLPLAVMLVFGFVVSIVTGLHASTVLVYTDELQQFEQMDLEALFSVLKFSLGLILIVFAAAYLFCRTLCYLGYFKIAGRQTHIRILAEPVKMCFQLALIPFGVFAVCELVLYLLFLTMCAGSFGFMRILMFVWIVLLIVTVVFIVIYDYYAMARIQKTLFSTRNG